MRKHTYVLIVLFMVAFLFGCAPLDTIVGYDPVTGVVDPEAPIGSVSEIAKGFGPWGVIVGGAAGIGASIYILIRKIQKKLKK